MFFLYKGKYYNEKGKAIEGYYMVKPLRYKRISSPFTQKRWHPILKRYRSHLGIDYAAPRGTPVWASANGRVSFVGRKGGYGKVVEIKHDNGYKTLYAHLKGFKKGIKRGKKVKKMQVIGYVGTTGLSTGPHLHFGLYKYKKAINPARLVKISKDILGKKNRRNFFRYIKTQTQSLKNALSDTKEIEKHLSFEYLSEYKI